MAPLATGASGINTVCVAPTHGMLALGTADGAVQCWDPRQRSLLGAVSPHESLGPEAAGSAPPEVTAMRFAPGGLQLSVGTASGHVAIYDIRRGAPLLVKDHQYGLPIRDIKYHRGHVVSADAKIIKLWEAASGKVFTNIQPAADINDVAVCADSGMLFLCSNPTPNPTPTPNPNPNQACSSPASRRSGSAPTSYRRSVRRRAGATSSTRSSSPPP